MIGVGVAGALLLALLAAWAIDGAGARTARRLELGGRDAGHLSKAKLQTLVTELAGNVAAAPIELAGETGTARSTAGALGLSLNEADTVQRALKAGRAAPLAIRPFQWLAGLFSTPRSALRFQLDRPALNDEVTRLADKLARAPIEPSITAAKDELRAVPGRPGSQPDIEALANQLTTIDLTMIDEPTRGAVTVLVAFLPRAPRSSDSDAKALVSLLTEATAKPMTATLAKESRELEGGELRALIRPGTKPGQLSFELDPEGVDKLLKAAFDGVGTPSKPARLEISAGRS